MTQSFDAFIIVRDHPDATSSSEARAHPRLGGPCGPVMPMAANGTSATWRHTRTTAAFRAEADHRRQTTFRTRSRDPRFSARPTGSGSSTAFAAGMARHFTVQKTWNFCRLAGISIVRSQCPDLPWLAHHFSTNFDRRAKRPLPAGRLRTGPTPRAGCADGSCRFACGRR